MSFVRLVNVTKRFGDVTAVNNLNISIDKGECFSMLGPSGCGKTTTLRMVAGFEDLSEGEIWVGNKLFSSPTKHLYIPPEDRNFGMVFQAFAVWPHMTVYENVAFPLKIRKIEQSEIKRRTEDALKATNLLSFANGSPADLSGGGKQRVALARALAINPDVMLLDEPLSSLDPHLREEMRFEIKELQNKYGFSIIYVTHDQSEAMALSHRILVMKLGKVQQIDTPINIYNNPANSFVFSFIGVSNFTDVEWRDSSAFISGSNETLLNKIAIPENMKQQAVFSLATRPAEICFTNENDENAVSGKVLRRAFLGEIVDYLVRVGNQEIRVQIGRKDKGPEVDEICYIKFRNPYWFNKE